METYFRELGSAQSGDQLSVRKKIELS